jgi:hypothetical protein
MTPTQAPPVTLFIPLLAEALARSDARLPLWLRANKRRVQQRAAPASLGALLERGYASVPAPTDPRGMWPEERAHRFVWSEIAAALGVIIAHGAIPLPGSADPARFVARVRDAAMRSAQSRNVHGKPTVEGAYELLLRWLGEWDADFVTAQNDAEKRAARAIEHVAEIRKAAPATSLTRKEKPARVRREAPRVQPVEPNAEHLIAALHAREGSVLDRGVRVIEDRRFKSYESVLENAWRDLAGSDTALAERRRRGDIEVLSEQGGYAGGRDAAGKRAAILEYVVHPFTPVDSDV